MKTECRKVGCNNDDRFPHQHWNDQAKRQITKWGLQTALEMAQANKQGDLYQAIYRIAGTSVPPPPPSPVLNMEGKVYRVEYAVWNFPDHTKLVEGFENARAIEESIKTWHGIEYTNVSHTPVDLTGKYYTGIKNIFTKKATFEI